MVQNKGGGAKKYGRNEKKCARYRAEGRCEKNRIKRNLRNKKRSERLLKLKKKRAKSA